MEKEKLMEKEIEEKRKLTKEVKDKIDNEVFYNYMIAIFIMIYMFFINFGFSNLETDIFKIYTKVLAIILICLTVVFFEISYRKDNLKFALTGIELLICSIIVIYIPYIYFHSNVIVRGIVMLDSIFFGVYYSIKNYIVYKKEAFKYQDNLSDIKELVKEEDANYIEEDSKKIIKEIRELEEKRKQEEKIIKEKKKQKNKEEQIKNKIKKTEQKIKEDKKVIKKDIKNKKGNNKND